MNRLSHNGVSVAYSILLLLLLTDIPLHTAQVQDNSSRFSHRLAIFTTNVYTKLVTQNPNQNIIFSPLSIQSCAAMTRMGARGETAAQLDRGLALISNNEAQIADSFHKVLAAYNKSSYIHIASKIYIKDGYHLRDEFTSIISKQFLSATEPIDFTKNIRAAGKINSWVEQRTNNLIRDLVPPSELDNNTHMVLINAVHFKGIWVHQFPKKTKKEPFYLNNAKSIKVPMMNLRERLRYAELRDIDATALELPYNNSDLSMLIVLPNSNNGLPQLERKLRSTPLSQITRALNSEDVIVKLPKFKSEFKVELTESFKQLGMTNMFSNNADFSRMIKSQYGLKVSKFIHRAFIDVNERGAQASVSNAIKIDFRACIPMILRAAQQIQFYANHPFIYYIINNQGIVLFAGKLLKP
ncbi:antichymotrypsin-2-like [Drosophila albomicans]|uniref:Antichymotrypsin-2-like n=1 Tax=Drosophila albomicans TaxID=7291 RepID=A0A6P8X0N9_DROAB|nr:antichymotrypsin-2-like [Drosophila albomicans]